VRTLNTEDYAASDRLRVWRSHVDSALFAAHYSLYGTAGLTAQQRSIALEEFGLFDFVVGAHAVERTVDLVEQHPKHSLFLSLITAGQAVHYGADSILVLQPGEFIVYDPDRPYLMAFQNGTRQLFLDVPREVLQHHGLMPTTSHPQKFDRLRQAGSGVRATDLAELARVLHDPSSDTRGLNATVMRALRALNMATTAPTRSHHLEHAMRFVRDNALTATLDAQTIAAAVGISSRHLSREFRTISKTPMQYVLEVRLDAAKELLATSTLPITRIAQECGFTSSTSFARAFSSVVGQAPREFRHAAQTSMG
jgi:AraC-like DNA-binding protein